jgi:hypothetical protein
LARIALYAAGYSLRWDLNTGSGAMMSRRSDNGRVQQLYQIADNAAAAVINGGTASLVQAQGGKSGFEALWFNFDQRKFSVTNTEMLWHIAEYGATTNSALSLRNGRISRRNLWIQKSITIYITKLLPVF